ncbi:MAG: MFS transporter [Thermoguttaceae bacterium]
MAIASDAPAGGPTPARGTRLEVFAWALYDWANSAYSTILITILLLYLTTVVFDKDDPWGSTLYAWGISLSMMTAAFLSPIVGALADANRSKRRWLARTALPGAAGAVLLAAVSPGWTWLIVLLFVLVSLCFELSIGIYNAFLPEIADERSMNMVSAWGFALGYVGGALPLILAFLLVKYGADLGVPDRADQLRLGTAIMGLWWGGFSLPTLWILRDRGQAPLTKEPLLASARKALAEVGSTLRNVRRYRILALFLLGFLFYNEGVQTVLSQASVFATQTPELSFDEHDLPLLVLLIQFLALPGAMLVGGLADLLGQKRTLIGCLAAWVAIVAMAFFVASKWQFWVLGGMVAMIMGGTQALSRAVMGVMTPPQRAAEFFGFFNFSSKATSFMGPFLFGTIFRLSGNPRPAIVSLLVFFLIGWALVARIDIAAGRRQAFEA